MEDHSLHDFALLSSSGASPHAHYKGCHCAVESLVKLELYMYFAIKDRDLVRFRRLLSTGLGADHWFSEAVPRDGHHTTVLQLAVQENFVDAVEVLLTSSAATASTDAEPTVVQENNIQTAFMYGMKYNMIDIIRVFLKAAIADEILLDLSTAFRHAMYKAQYDLVREIIQKPRFDINLEATWGMDRPLHIVVHHNQVALVEQLLLQGALVNAEDRKGTTPLVVACSLGFVLCAEILLRHGADPNHRNHNFFSMQTPLNVIMKGARLDPDIVLQLLRLLLAAGLNLRNEAWLLTGPANPQITAATHTWLEEQTRQPLPLKQTCFVAIRKQLMRHTAGCSYGKSLDTLPIAPGLKNFLKMQSQHI